MQVSYNVLNVMCGGCATSIQNNLKSLEGVNEVTVEIESGRVTIVGEDIDEQVVKTTLNKIGYPVDDTSDLLAKAKGLLS